MENKTKPEANACDPSTQEAKAGELRAQGQPGLPNEALLGNKKDGRENLTRIVLSSLSFSSLLS